MFPKFLLDSDDDWQESLRRWLYPKLHPYLESVGGYAIGTFHSDQYVGKVAEDEETIEEELDEVARRNPIACLKSLPDGRLSEGSWVIIHEDAPELIQPGMQLHMTLFEREDGKPGREFHAHYEDDWRASPFDHLNAANYQIERGVNLATEYLNNRTYLTLQ